MCKSVSIAYNPSIFLLFLRHCMEYSTARRVGLEQIAAPVEQIALGNRALRPFPRGNGAHVFSRPLFPTVTLTLRLNLFFCILYHTCSLSKLDPTVLRLFSGRSPGETLGHGIYFLITDIWYCEQHQQQPLLYSTCPLLWLFADSQSRKRLFFDFHRVSPSDHLLTKQPVDSGYEPDIVCHNY